MLVTQAEVDEHLTRAEAQSNARLDWLECAGDVGIGVLRDQPGDGHFCVTSDVAPPGVGLTLRAAIDAARRHGAPQPSAPRAGTLSPVAAEAAQRLALHSKKVMSVLAELVNLNSREFKADPGRDYIDRDTVMHYVQKLRDEHYEVMRIARSALLDASAPEVQPDEDWNKWTQPDYVRLHAGEMTAQEMRTVQAVVRAMLAQRTRRAPTDEELATRWALLGKGNPAWADRVRGLLQYFGGVPPFRVSVARLQASSGGTYAVCLDRTDRIDDSPAEWGRLTPAAHESLRAANKDAEMWARFLRVPFTPLWEPGEPA